MELVDLKSTNNLLMQKRQEVSKDLLDQNNKTMHCKKNGCSKTTHVFPGKFEVKVSPLKKCFKE